MGKVAAFIDNKVNYEVWADGRQIERVLVHPNLLVIPAKGALYQLAVDDGSEHCNPRNSETVGRVLDVQFKQSIVRRIVGPRKDEIVDAQMKQSIVVLVEVLHTADWVGFLQEGPIRH